MTAIRTIDPRLEQRKFLSLINGLNVFALEKILSVCDGGYWDWASMDIKLDRLVRTKEVIQARLEHEKGRKI